MTHTQTNWIDLALRYGGFMKMDTSFLENFLAQLSDEEKLRYLLPSPQVINASFSELYEKKNPQEATHYFYGMMRHLGKFTDKPKFDMEGAPGYERFRYIRLNIDGEAHAFCYLNAQEEGQIFSLLPKKIDEPFLMKIAQIFPNYVIFEKKGVVYTKPQVFVGWDTDKPVSSLTDTSENADYIRFSGYNIPDLTEQAENTKMLGDRYYQFFKQKFTIYQKKK
ncbi:MAG: hypothetical protein LBI11_01665 [Streptococcaceae bacterium]|jgi:hypothetical protein|nr:hypothetical protein [Streptococcaceae bacterium]